MINKCERFDLCTFAIKTLRFTLGLVQFDIAAVPIKQKYTCRFVNEHRNNKIFNNGIS